MIYKSVILKSEYLPPISTYWALLHSENAYLEVNENYQKKSTRNRAQILGVNGVETLSVPLDKGKNSKMPIEAVTISDENNWRGKHLHSIKSAYGNAPYFDYYFDTLKGIIKSKHINLLSLNQELFDFFVTSLDIDINLHRTEEYVHSYNENYCDLRKLKFNETKLNGYSPKVYNQVFEEKHGFIPGLSILDLLMCKGPESILYI